jgi:hypothetical protein
LQKVKKEKNFHKDLKKSACGHVKTLDFFTNFWDRRGTKVEA